MRNFLLPVSPRAAWAAVNGASASPRRERTRGKAQAVLVLALSGTRADRTGRRARVVGCRSAMVLRAISNSVARGMQQAKASTRKWRRVNEFQPPAGWNDRA